ncbi:unnamed protein product, partial [marine sediment metagenome]
ASPGVRDSDVTWQALWQLSLVLREVAESADLGSSPDTESSGLGDAEHGAREPLGGKETTIDR